MGKIESIEREIESLSHDELSALRRWFIEYDAAAWDAEIQADADDGKLDVLADSALEEHAAGKSREL